MGATIPMHFPLLSSPQFPFERTTLAEIEWEGVEARGSEKCLSHPYTRTPKVMIAKVAVDAVEGRPSFAVGGEEWGGRSCRRLLDG